MKTARVSVRTVLFLVSTSLAFAACEAGDVQVTDAGRDAYDARSTVDTGARTDTSTPDVPSFDEGTDTGNDTGRDVPTGTDVVTATDTGPTYCPTNCNTDLECQSQCPTPFAGYHYCCNYGAGGGSCSQRASACDGTGMTAGTLGAACHADSECNVGAANCCLTIGSAGTCGCTGSFGCQPAMLCM